jgi:hypothetical protein
VARGAGRLRGQGPHLDYPQYRTALTRRRAELTALEESVGKGIQRTRQANGDAVLDAQPNRSEWQKTVFHLLWHQVVLLAMKHGRAPLPVSPAVWKGLQKSGALNDLYDLGSIARRLSFLGDERLLLAELRTRTATTRPIHSDLPTLSAVRRSGDRVE